MIGFVFLRGAFTVQPSSPLIWRDQLGVKLNVTEKKTKLALCLIGEMCSASGKWHKMTRTSGGSSGDEERHNWRIAPISCTDTWFDAHPMSCVETIIVSIADVIFCVHMLKLCHTRENKCRLRLKSQLLGFKSGKNKWLDTSDCCDVLMTGSEPRGASVVFIYLGTL